MAVVLDQKWILKSTIERVLDPVTYLPVVEPHQVNCKFDHIFSEVTAQNLFKNPGEKTCPICHDKITIYRPMPDFQRVIDQAYEIKKGDDHVNQMIGLFRAQIDLIRNDESRVQNWVYPISQSQFTLGKMDERTWHGGPCSYVFVNRTSDERCIKKIDFYIYDMPYYHKLSLGLSFYSQEPLKAMQKTFQEQGIDGFMHWIYDDHLTIRIKTSHETRQIIDLFNFVIRNNTFDRKSSHPIDSLFNAIYQTFEDHKER